ncbi:hypothetical protein [Jannaschia sp. 2305UL9-9]
MIRFLMNRMLWRLASRIFGSKTARNARTAQKAARIARRLGR